MIPESDLSEFLRSGVVPAFPRDYGIPRKVAYDDSHFSTMVRLSKGYNAHTSVYSRWEWENSIASTFLLDIDGDTYWDSLRFLVDIKPLIKGFKVRAYFTGNRGFHVYIDFPPTKLDLRSSVMGFLERYLGGIEWERYIDRQVIGDWRHMARLPGAVHEKNGGTARLVWESKGMNVPDLRFTSQNLILKSFGPKRLTKGNHPPCILYLLDLLRTTHDLSHYQRIHLASYLLNIMDPEEVTDIFMLAEDYKRSVTEYYVRYLDQKGWRPFGCIKAKQYGICPVPLQQNGCPFFPDPSRALR